MKKSLLILCSFLCLSLSLSACSSDQISGDPTEAITNYYKGVQSNDLALAYSTIASSIKAKLSLEDFTLYEKLIDEEADFKSFSVTKVTDDKTTKLDGVEYKNIVAYDVSELELDYSTNEEKTLTFRRYVIGENGTWKMYRAITKADIADEYLYVGRMYLYGKGKTQSTTKAIEYFNNALKYDSTSDYTHYYLGVAYYYQQQYTESMAEEQLCINTTSEVDLKSDAYNVIGLNYAKKADLANAKSAFEQSLQLNPDNEYAKGNLNYYCK